MITVTDVERMTLEERRREAKYWREDNPSGPNPFFPPGKEARGLPWKPCDRGLVKGHKNAGNSVHRLGRRTSTHPNRSRKHRSR